MRLLGTILGWLFFVDFLILGVFSFVTGGILSGIFFLLLAVICSPFRDKLFSLLPERLNRLPMRIGAGVLAFILSFAFLPVGGTTTTKEVASQAEEAVELVERQSLTAAREVRQEAEKEAAEKKAAEETEKKEQEAAAKKAAEEAEKKAQEEAAAKKSAEEAEKKAQEDAAAKKAAEEAEKKAQEEAAAKKAAEEAEKKAQEEAAAKKAAEEAERKAQEEAAAKKAQEEVAQAQSFQVTAPATVDDNQTRSAAPAAVAPAGGGGGNADNFDLYYNPEQRQTEDTYVLNTSTLKIHYPTCKDVVKIKAENYATSNQSIEALQAQGYSRCGHCMK